MIDEGTDGGNRAPLTTLGFAGVRQDLAAPIQKIIESCDQLFEEAEADESYRLDLNRIRKAGVDLVDLIKTELRSQIARERSDEEWRRLIHDLRTPVNHIVGYSEILAEEAADSGRSALKDKFDAIRDEARAWLPLMEKSLAGSVGGKDPEADEIRANDAKQVESLNETVGTNRSSSPGVVGSESGRILVIDDDEANRDLLKRRLKQQGHRVETAVDGEAGLDRLSDGEYDLVLLDLLMPGLNGVEVLTRMKEDPQLNEIPVIVISALDDESGIARCIELGAEDYLSKPFYPAVLRARIGTCLEKRRLRAVEKRHLAEIQEERRKSDRLLLNILPEAVADRLKSGEEQIADHFAEVTVLFADLVDFTVLSEESGPAGVVGILNRIFSTFDLNADRHGLEKIKTIGDAYMAVCGLPHPREDHAEAVAAFALDLMDDLDRLNGEFESVITLRVGIDTGPVIAGIVGINKFIYDLWGDTVNMASRMESHGVPGRIQVTERTWKKLKRDFTLTSRGEIDVKGKGSMKTWFLERPGLSSESDPG